MALRMSSIARSLLDAVRGRRLAPTRNLAPIVAVVSEAR
jgi:hypothetical protein